MRTIITSVLFLFLSLSCKKYSDCGCDSRKSEGVEKIFGMVLETDDGFEIISDEKGLLLPCYALPDEFRKDGQFVTVSGKLGVPCEVTGRRFTVTPIDISSITLRTSAYNKTDITLTIIKSEDYGLKKGFGFFIEDKRQPYGTRLLAAEIPSMPGFDTFCSREQAMKTGIAWVYKIRSDAPTLRNPIDIDEAFLKYIHVLRPC